MFRLMSIFKRNHDEQLDDSAYDFNEISVSENDLKGIVETPIPVSGNSTSGRKEIPPVATPSIEANRQETSDKADIERVREKLTTITDKNSTQVGEANTSTFSVESQDGEIPFDVNGKTLLGRGGENFVYAIPDDPTIVGRVAIEPIIEQLAHKGTAAGETLQEKLDAEIATYDELCRYFGNEHVPQTTRAIRQIPLSKEFLDEIHKDKGRTVPDVTPVPTDILTIVATQEKVTQINDPESLDVQGGLAEARNPKIMNTEGYKDAYENATNALICDPESPSFDLDQFLVIHPGLRAIVDQARGDPQLKTSLTDFVQKAMRYSKETGKSLDLNGAKNILFFKNTDNSNSHGAWDYKLIDATSPYAEVALVKSKELMEKVMAKEPIEDHLDRHLLRSAVNYERTLNGLAKQLGVEDPLDLIPYASTVRPSEFWDVLYDGGPPVNPNQEQGEKAG